MPGENFKKNLIKAEHVGIIIDLATARLNAELEHRGAKRLKDKEVMQRCWTIRKFLTNKRIGSFFGYSETQIQRLLSGDNNYERAKNIRPKWFLK